MMNKFEQIKSNIIEKIVQKIESKLTAPQAQLSSEFVRQFYAMVASNDLQEHSIADLYGAALSLWRNLNEGHKSKIHVYNPDFEQHGWQSTHTIVEIIHQEMPFLVDSVRSEINHQGLTQHLIIYLSGFKAKYAATGEVTAVLPISSPRSNQVVENAVIYIEIDRQTDKAVLHHLAESLQRILADVSVSVEDWQKMRGKVIESIKDLDTVKNFVDEAELVESKDFLHWITENHFTFLGCRDYDLVKEGDEQLLRIIKNTGLGVLRESVKHSNARNLSTMAPAARALALSSQILIISKTNTKSTVHRPVYTDYIGIKRFDKKGRVIGERRFIGLYTAAAYNSSPRDIPFLRRKVVQIIEKSTFYSDSHAGKALLNILENLPRDDLLQGNIDELLDMSLGIFYLQERRRIRLFVRRDIFGRFMSCLVYVPRDKFNTELREVMQDILAKTFHALEINFSTFFSDSVLTRIHFVLRISVDAGLDIDLQELEQRLIAAGRSWEDGLSNHLIEAFGEETGNRYINKYARAFPVAYKEYFQSRTAVFDIKHIERLSRDKSIEMNFYRPVEDTSGMLRFKINNKISMFF